MSDELRRIEVLERLMRHLTLEVATLRADVRALRGAPGRAGAGPTAEPDLGEMAADVFAAEPGGVGALGDEQPVARASEGAAAPGGPPHIHDMFEAAASRHRDRAAESIPAPTAGRPAAGPDLESLVGRYGTIALAVLTIVMGLGAFLRWAVEHVRIGPEVRVATGAVAAVATAALGWRLRQRGARQYGNTLIGLSLALVHVVAWGAGPYLRLVPGGVALAIAAIASVALAALAWREREELLFAAGLFGALLAPFVTTRDSGSPELLLLYGTALVVTSTTALRRGDWRVARRLLSMGTLLYAGAAMADMPATGADWLRRAEAPAFALVAALVAVIAAGERHRRPLAYGHLASALLVLLAFATPAPPLAAALVLGLAGATLAGVASRGEGDASASVLEYGLSSTGSFTVGAPASAPVPWVGATGFPLAFLGVALFQLDEPVTPTGAGVALAFAAVSAGFAARAWPAGPERRGAHLVAAGVALVAALPLAFHEDAVVLASLLTVLGVVTTTLGTRTATPLALVPAMMALTLGTMVAGLELLSRPAWDYTPFATAASFAMLVVTVGWWLASRELAVPSARSDATTSRVDDAGVLRGVAFAVAFAWGHEELRHAWTPALATFLLVAWYATTGVVTIGVGRVRGSAIARRVGLALAVLAAVRAITQASRIDAIGLRVGSFLLVGAFLLGVAWWYRAGDAPPAMGVEGAPPSPPRAGHDDDRRHAPDAPAAPPVAAPDEGAGLPPSGPIARSTPRR